MRLSRVAQVPLLREVYGVDSVHAVHCSGDPACCGSLSFMTIWLDPNRLLSGVVKELFHDAIGAAPSLSAKAQIGFAHYLWAQLHPDIGDGPRGSLGKRKVHFDSLFALLCDDGMKPSVERGLAVLENWGRKQRRLPTFVAWKKKLHFEDPHPITARDMRAAERFFADCSGELTERYLRRRERREWRTFGDGDEFGRDFLKRVRRDSQALADRASLSNGGRKAATLVAHRYLARLQNLVVEEVLANLPPGLLGAFGERVFRWMWWSDPSGDDDVGRFDIPIMNSPALAGAIEHGAPPGLSNGGSRRFGTMVDDLIVFAKARTERRRVRRSTAVEIALGFGASYRLFLDDIRNKERELKERIRHPRSPIGS